MEENNITEGVVPIVATEAALTEQVIAELDRRIGEIEAAIGELRSVKASEVPPGRKTQVAAMAQGTPHGASVDDALLSLSVEQRIAVKSGLMRAGLLQ
jgi:hypothetical protein